MYWNKYKESGIWWAKRLRLRAMFRNHDCFYLALGKLRFRLMKRGTSDAR